MILIIPKSIPGEDTFSLGIGYLASMLKKQNKEVKVINCGMVHKWMQIIDNWIKEDKSKFAGITTDVSNIGNAIYISNFIRDKYPEVKIIFGGPYATAIYKELLPKYADIVVLGEGEKTIVKITEEQNLRNIKGIAYFDDEIKINLQEEKITDLDALPFPIQVGSVYDGNVQYDEGNFLYPFHFTARLMTSRGCPYNCMHCTKLIHGYKIRLRSINNVMKEIEYLVKRQNATRIEIFDDNFTFYPDRVKMICKEIIRKNYKNLMLILLSGVRFDTGDMEMFKLLKKAGFCDVAIAVESGSQEVVDKLGRKIDLDKAVKTFNIARRVGLVTYGQFMWGTPFDNKETLKKTIEIAKKINPDVIIFSMVRPFPGTKLYDYILKHGKFLHNLLENFPSYYNPKMIYEMPGVNNKEIEKMYYWAYIKYYFRIRFFFNLFKNNITSLRNIKSLFTTYKFIVHTHSFFIKDYFTKKFQSYFETIKKI